MHLVKERKLQIAVQVMTRLPATKKELKSLSYAQLCAAILERRSILRESRDAKGDDRCFITDYLVEDFLIDTPVRPAFTAKELLRKCQQFYEYCGTHNKMPVAQPAPSHPNSDTWDDDLFDPNFDKLDELVKIQKAAEHFRDVAAFRHRSIIDYRRLYSILPEKIEADYTLPPMNEFLGVAKPNAGCPHFMDSHANCGKSCNLYKWGPCAERPLKATTPI